ncbi:FlxA-like family protein [Erwinia rhapontici]|uniref:FlxA-like protein n=1 Tax=Erwinia rhapontici TaxID=55212 RepID=A0ABM7N3W8_ERWRD|nr:MULTISPECIES: FlxA-like family protein [Erwinia]MCS3608870.1 ClpP class serine protease [Erwinia rhapontici]NNS07245.1 hypothetical protein [Erwinia sp. JH02]UDQ79105.1 FlxA-like family protein [Erwinia rhapontici]BCQ36005.1 hypothetical protein ERHA53_33480 [Erwinia rhapontici]BCQ46241.1 hypothetical protein ERHA55_37680 [Erwinia rhapontici]
MTTINTSSSVSGSSSGGGSVSQTASIYKQIVKLQEQLKNLSGDTTLTTEQKSEQQQLIESQIALLQSQIAQIQQQEAEKAAEKQQESKAADSGSSKIADGVNRPTENNKLNVYI